MSPALAAARSRRVIGEAGQAAAYLWEKSPTMPRTPRTRQPAGPGPAAAFTGSPAAGAGRADPVRSSRYRRS